MQRSMNGCGFPEELYREQTLGKFAENLRLQVNVGRKVCDIGERSSYPGKSPTAARR